MKFRFRSVLICLIVAGLAAVAQGAVERFPPPDLGADYVYPHSFQAAPRANWLAYLDTAFLIGALIMATLIALRWRSRRAMMWLSVFSLAYLGFWRLGCVCPIGAIQNVSQAVCDSSFVLPWVVLAFFGIPIFFALLFGRVFCSGVCPLGALQDLVILKPVRTPRWLNQGLSVIPFLYLGLAILFAATGARYIICQYDPMVSFFRMSARFTIWIWSAAILGIGLFIPRPYCRFLCPYGALLGIASRFAPRRASITPRECVHCGLCRDACPFDAIHEGAAEEERS